MRDYKKSVKITLMIINLSIVLLFALAIFLPSMITNYTEVRGKDESLPTVVMLTSYPCFPFAAVALFSIRKLLKNILNGLVFGDQNIFILKKISLCCIGGSAITFIAGFFYLPFFAICIAAGGCAIIIKVIKDVFDAELQSRRDKMYEDMRNEI